MPATPPFHEFAMRHPAFEAVLPSRVELALADAAAMYDAAKFTNEQVWRRAVMLRAAHDLTVEGFGEGMEASLARQGLSGFSSVSDGSVSASRPVSPVSGNLETTSYGRALSYLLRFSVSRVTVATGNGAYVYGSPEYVSRRD